MQSMNAALADLVRAGLIRRDVALERSSTPAELQRLMESESLAVMGNGRPARAAV
jgi:hypothetical protein